MVSEGVESEDLGASFSLPTDERERHVGRERESPWIVADHYVVVQRWRPLFDPYDESFKKLAVWLRIPGLPIELYSSNHLWKIGGIFGRTLKIDKNSLKKVEGVQGEVTDRARFARICVEIDLRKSLLSKFQFIGKVYQVGYEGLHMVCFACGQYSRRKDICSNGGAKDAVKPQKPVSILPQTERSSDEGRMEGKEKDDDDAFSAWMVVQRPTRGRRPRVFSANQGRGTVYQTKNPSNQGQRTAAQPAAALSVPMPVPAVQNQKANQLESKGTDASKGTSSVMQIEEHTSLTVVTANNTVCSWNCRGANKKGLTCLIRDIVRKYDIKVLALLETRISGTKATRKIKQMGFDVFHKQDPVGFSGDLWLLWNKSDVEWKQTGKEENITLIYTSPRRVERRALWSDIHRLCQRGPTPWLLLGDFNSVTHAYEKKGGKPPCQRSIPEFTTCLDICNLEDLGHSGLPFTWRRGNLFERLDRAVSNVEGMLAFPQRYVFHLSFFNSDHRQLLLRDRERNPGSRETKPFRFLASWLTRQDFKVIVEESWDGNSDWVQARQKFENEATTWHCSIFKEHLWRKHTLHARLMGINRELGDSADHNLERLKGQLWNELQTIYAQEELNLFQRSRCNWLVFWDGDDRFYHTATNVRRRQNKNHLVQDDHGA
ncbi:uncharacterized protein LOC133284682 [Gastrolobium bilobum]|uniref:uncharacterized protein LOC133284682 n=1 Tax=Gastrolobium bilobum TaxID=150636 RepID=UPI002AB1EB8B|nr:uncharacterized protein LOC133284682 [Gastrolobium bilobum]